MKLLAHELCAQQHTRHALFLLTTGDMQTMTRHLQAAYHAACRDYGAYQQVVRNYPMLQFNNEWQSQIELEAS